MADLKTHKLVQHDFVAQAAEADQPEQPQSIQEEAVADSRDASASGGLTVFTAAVIVAGEMAGIGVLALPKAVADTTWIGLVLILVFGLAAMHTGRLLGYCWSILHERYEEYREHVRYPYPAIAQRAVGTWMRYVVSVAMDFTLFGAMVVFMLLASQNIQNLFKQVNVDISFCYWTLVVTACLIPLTWFGTPKDFWPIAVGALSATAVACVLVIVQSLLQIKNTSPKFEHTDNFLTFCGSFGAIAFAFGAHSTFPTIQHDMKQQEKFPKSCILAFSAVLVMYLPVAAAGYFVYGTDVSSNVLQSLPAGPITATVMILITAHLVCTIIIVMNPLSQDFEEALKLKHEEGITLQQYISEITWRRFLCFPCKRCLFPCCPCKRCLLSFPWRRCLLRTGIILVALFIAESLPHFGAVLNLVGGTSVTLLVFVFPPLFYICLCRAKGDWDEIEIPLHMYVINVIIMVVGAFSGVASTIAAIDTIANPNTFVPPCYINRTAAASGD